MANEKPAQDDPAQRKESDLPLAIFLVRLATDDGLRQRYHADKKGTIDSLEDALNPESKALLLNADESGVFDRLQLNQQSSGIARAKKALAEAAAKRG